MTHFVRIEVLVGSDPKLNRELIPGKELLPGQAVEHAFNNFMEMTAYHLRIQQKIQHSDQYKTLKYQSSGTTGVSEFGPQYSKIVAYRVSWGKVQANAPA